MNTPLYHSILNKRRESVQDGTIDSIFNGIVVDNPLTELDCSPDNGFDNFEHLVKGDRLVYAVVERRAPCRPRAITSRTIRHNRPFPSALSSVLTE